MLFVLLLLLLLALLTTMHFNLVIGMANHAKVSTFELSEVACNEAQVVAGNDVDKLGAVLPMCPLSADSNKISELKLLGPNFMLREGSIWLVPCAWLLLENFLCRQLT